MFTKFPALLLVYPDNVTAEMLGLFEVSWCWKFQIKPPNYHTVSWMKRSCHSSWNRLQLLTPVVGTGAALYADQVTTILP